MAAVSRQTRTRRVLVGALLSALAFLLATSVTQAAPASMTRVEHEALVGGGHLVFFNDILAGAPGQPWLAVGYVVDSDGNRNPSAWTSTDAESWQRFAMQETASPERRDGPMIVARRGDVTVAVGHRFEGTVRPAAWWSTSPNAWRALPVTDPMLAYQGVVEDMQAGADGFVAVGYRHNDSNTTVTVFHSADGRSWQVDSTFTTPANEILQPYGIASSGARIVVVGGSQSSAGARDGRIWVKANGIWQSVEPAALDLSGPGFQEVSGIAWDPTLGFVAGGDTALQPNVDTPTLWYSPTGDTWERLPIVEGAPAAVHRIITIPGGFMAAGSSDAGPRVWRSANGREWSSVPTPASGSSAGRRLTIGSDGVKIVFSMTNSSGSQVLYRDGTEWRRADRGSGFPTSKPHAAILLDVAVSKGRAVAVGADGDERPLIMYSAGTSWRRASLPDRAARLASVTARRGVFTIAGWRLVRNTARLALWTSRNGTKWRLVGGTRREPIGGFEEITPSSSGLLALALEPGQRGFRTIVWAPVRGIWLPVANLGAGIPRAICSGPHGVVVVSTSGSNYSRVLVWSKPPKRSWTSEAELIATNSVALGCADGRRGTVIVGTDQNRAAAIWRRVRPGGAWTKRVVGVSQPLTEILDVIRDGSGYLATGTSGERGQSDLAIWRSTDGAQWTRAGATDPTSLEPGFQAGFGVVRAGGRVVIVGSHGAANAGIWTGTP